MNAGGPSATVAALGEHAIIDRIRRRLPAPPPWLLVGPGDDAAVCVPARNELDVITTDAIVEGVHFDRSFVPPSSVGHRALAVNLSDLAAMGATPRLATLSLVLPADLPEADLDALLDGLLALAARTGTVVAGGNVTRSPGPLMVDVTAVGTVRRRRFLTRSGARPGDHVFVSGTLGDARAGLAACREAPGMDAPFVARYLQPEPRIRLGQLLGRNGAATAAVDLSDGLADGAHQLAAASGAGLLLEAGCLPIADGTRAWYAARGLDPVGEALEGGDDYELLFTVPRRRLGRLRHVQRYVGGLTLTRIGTVTREPGVRLTDGDGKTTAVEGGFEHFRTR